MWMTTMMMMVDCFERFVFKLAVQEPEDSIYCSFNFLMLAEVPLPQ
jgi:hypothetical protein